MADSTMQTIYLKPDVVTYLNHSAENEVTAIAIDMAEVAAAYPDGEPSVWWRRADGEVYMLDCEYADGYVTAVLKDIELWRGGLADVEAWWTYGQRLKKSSMYKVGIQQSFTIPSLIEQAKERYANAAEAIEALQAEYDETLEDVHTARDTAVTAWNAAEAAKEAAKLAETNAEAAATLAGDTVASIINKTTEAETAAEDALIYATLAQRERNSAQTAAENAATSESNAKNYMNQAQASAAAAANILAQNEAKIVEAFSPSASVKTDDNGDVTISVTYKDGTTEATIRANGNADELKNSKADVIEESVSGNSVTFEDGSDGLPVKKMVVSIEPVQAGSGNSSPDNVRPITGWTEANITQYGEDASDETKYTMKFPDEAGAVYSGTLDVLTGELTVTNIAVAVKDLSKATFTAGSRAVYQNWVLTKPSTVVKNQTYRGAISNLLTENNAYAGSSHVNEQSIKTGFAINTDGLRLGVHDNDTALTEEQLNAKYADLVVVYPLANPETYQLNPHEVKTLLGTNHIQADCGAVDITYRADTTLAFNALKAMILENLNA